MSVPGRTPAPVKTAITPVDRSHPPTRTEIIPPSVFLGDQGSAALRTRFPTMSANPSAPHNIIKAIRWAAANPTKKETGHV